MYCVRQVLSDYRKDRGVDVVVGHADATTAGYGIGKNHAAYLHKLGIDVIVGGENIYAKKDMTESIDTLPYVLRAANFPSKNPGRSRRVVAVGEDKVAVVGLLGMSGSGRVHPGNPYTYLPTLVDRIKDETAVIILVYHAATTAEKAAMFHHADGMVSAVIGVGQNVQTGDERVLPGRTAVISDAGRTGSRDSVNGREPGPEITRFLTGIPQKSEDSWENLGLEGVELDIEPDGTPTAIRRVRVPCTKKEGAEKENEGDRDGNGS